MSGPPSAFLLDIEGTTTPLDFVTRVLFPYARARLAGHLARHEHEAETRDEVRALRGEHERDTVAGLDPPPWADTPAGVAGYAHWLMDQDRKVTSLKSLQGRIWEAGFQSGELAGVLYEDVPRALARWRSAGRTVAIFSSGSVLAQRLLFGHSDAGDFRPFLAAYYDTTTGPKREPDSYRRIAEALARPPGAILFVSDVAAELDAAQSAGLLTALCVREGAAPADPSHRVIRMFDELP